MGDDDPEPTLSRVENRKVNFIRTQGNFCNHLHEIFPGQK